MPDVITTIGNKSQWCFENNQQRTEEVKDIIERMPASFSFWVSLIIISLAFVLLLFGFIVKHPDVIRGQVTISTSQAPVKLIAATTGRIGLLQSKSGDMVNADKYIAVIKNPANTGDIRIVDSLLKKINIHSIDYDLYRNYFPQNVSLGEINNKYFAFLNALYEYLDYYHEKPYDKEKDILEKLSSTQKITLQQDIADYGRLKTKYQLAFSFYKREEKLFNQKVIAAAELEQAHISLIGTEQEFKSIDKEINASKYQIQDADNKMQQLVFQRLDKDRQLSIDLLNSYYDVQDNIRQWEHKYVFMAPIKGKLEFLNFWKNDNYIEAGQEMFTVVPLEDKVYGQVLLPEQGAGKVIIGQTVILKLDGYPYTQYGSVKGVVKSISRTTNQQILSSSQNKINAYLVTLDLPNGLKTNYGTVLPFKFEAKGTAEIITKDRKLIERLFDNLRHSMH